MYQSIGDFRMEVKTKQPGIMWPQLVISSARIQLQIPLNCAVMTHSEKRIILILLVRIKGILESLPVEWVYSPMVREIADMILIMIPTSLMQESELPMGIILVIWVSDTLLPRKRVRIPLGILVWMIVLYSAWTWTRMVSLNGMGIKDRKFSAPETGQHGRF